jgi:flagellar motor switch protein FliG
MITFSAEERLALLLSVLGNEIAQNAFAGMQPGQAGTLRKLYQEFKSDPPSPEEVEFVISDFLRYFDFAIDTLGIDLEELSDQQSQTKRSAKSDASNGTIFFPPLSPSDDPVGDLNRLDSYQIVKAIGNDHPKTIALILRKINVKQAAKVLELLTPEIRGGVVGHLTVDSTVPIPLVNQVLKTTVQKACLVNFRPPDIDQSKVMADLMRSLPKKLRVELMHELGNADPDLAKRVKEKLYLFEDILRLEDRDTQKLLSQIDTDSLIVGLQRCEQELINKLLGNLSKRARETILEEMEYKKGVSDEEVNNARYQIVQVLARLDESGEIKL